jgi:hypothetical protein
MLEIVNKIIVRMDLLEIVRTVPGGWKPSAL